MLNRPELFALYEQGVILHEKNILEEEGENFGLEASPPYVPKFGERMKKIGPLGLLHGGPAAGGTNTQPLELLAACSPNCLVRAESHPARESPLRQKWLEQARARLNFDSTARNFFADSDSTTDGLGTTSDEGHSRGRGGDPPQTILGSQIGSAGPPRSFGSRFEKGVIGGVIGGVKNGGVSGGSSSSSAGVGTTTTTPRMVGNNFRRSHSFAGALPSIRRQTTKSFDQPPEDPLPDHIPERKVFSYSSGPTTPTRPRRIPDLDADDHPSSGRASTPLRPRAVSSVGAGGPPAPSRGAGGGGTPEPAGAALPNLGGGGGGAATTADLRRFTRSRSFSGFAAIRTTSQQGGQVRLRKGSVRDLLEEV